MVKHFARAIRIFVLLLLLALAYLAIWLQGGARDINWARGFLLDALNPPNAPYAITIGDVSVRWQNITQFGDVRVANMQMTRKDGGIFATVNDVNLTLDPIGFLPGRRMIHGLSIDQPRVFLTRDEQGVLGLGLQGMPETLPVAELAGFFASDDSKTESTRRRVPFRELEIRDARLLFTDVASGAKLRSDHMSFEIGREGRDLHGSLSMPFVYRDQPGSIDAGVMTQAVGGNRMINARLENVPSELICLLAPCPADMKFEGAISGKVSLKKPPRQPISGGSMALTTQNATFTAPEMFAEPITLKKASISASGADQFRTITVSTANLDVPDTKIALTAALQKREDGWYASGEAICAKLKIGKLYKYWPLPLAADSRAWVTGQLSKGYAESGQLTFDITPADMGDTLRDEAISATVIARDLTVDYIPGFPPISAANGVAKFSGKKIFIDIESGKLLDATTLKPSTLAFTNLDIPATPMETTLNLSASASNVATMLKLPPFTFDDSVNLDPARITGAAEATIKLAFDAFSNESSSGGEVDFSSIKYDVAGTMTDIAQPDLLGDRDVSGFSGTITANAQGAELSGNVKVDGSNVSIVLKDGPASSDTTLAAKGTLATAQFEKFGIPAIEQLGSGTIGLDVALKLGANSQTLERGSIDLTQVPVTIEEISWQKPVGAKAALDVAPVAAPRSYSLKLDAAGLSLGNASLTFNEAMDDIEALSLPAVKTATSDFALQYAAKPGGYVITLSGAALDISGNDPVDPAAATPPAPVEEKKPEPSLLANFPALDLTLDLKKLVLVKEYPLSDLKGTLRCDVARCTNADIRARIGDGELRATIGTSNGKRQLLVTNNDAGALLRALDISDRVFGGTLTLDAEYDDTKTPAPMLGRLQISKFKLKNSQILARIISIGSLSGLVNVLTGQGIDFDSFKANIGALSGVFNVTKGRADSNALGLTVEGSLDTNASQVDLKGVVVPVSSLNSLFGKLPIIGALAGGEGEGLIAFNYSVKGAMDDPDVFVNPLSGLTPGFLRGIFTAGDKKIEAVPESATDKPTVPAEEVPATPVPWPSEKGKR